MDLINAFLLVTLMAYIPAALLAKKISKTVNHLLIASVIGAAVYIDNAFIWAVLSAAYTCLAVGSFLGEQDWGSIEQNLLMTVWDLLVALCCLLKVA